jgi:hypothetical protein
MKTVSTHHRAGHASRNGHKSVAVRTEALAAALFTQLLRRLFPSLRAILPPPRDLLVWQLRRRALQRAEEQRKRERRRKVALATTGVALGAALAAARVLSRR